MQIYLSGGFREEIATSISCRMVVPVGGGIGDPTTISVSGSAFQAALISSTNDSEAASEVLSAREARRMKWRKLPEHLTFYSLMTRSRARKWQNLVTRYSKGNGPLSQNFFFFRCRAHGCKFIVGIDGNFEVDLKEVGAGLDGVSQRLKK